jgi:hypothetical protein
MKEDASKKAEEAKRAEVGKQVAAKKAEDEKKKE